METDKAVRLRATSVVRAGFCPTKSGPIDTESHDTSVYVKKNTSLSRIFFPDFLTHLSTETIPK